MRASTAWLRLAWVAALLLLTTLAQALPLAHIPGASLGVLEGLSMTARVQEVAELPASRFAAHAPRHVYRVSMDSPLWLHLKIPSPAAPQTVGQALQLELPSVLVDRYELYQRDASGLWQMSAAGDRVAHATWPLNSLRPRFALQADANGALEAYIRVVHQLPTNLQPQMVNAADALQRDGMQMLWTGLLLGVVFTLVMACAQMSWAYRDVTYVWYALYLLFTLLAALCYSGMAQAWLWPQATKFASDAVVYAVMAAFAFNVQFSRAMFGSLQGRAYHMIAHLLFALCLGYMLMTLLTERYANIIVAFNAISAAVFVFIMYSALSAWRKGVRFASYWLLVYAPYLLVIGVVLAKSMGLVSAPWLPSETPVIAAVVEAVAMMLCINAHSKLRHAQAVQQQVSAWHDPLTGFLNASSFRQKATELWQAAPAQRRNVAVAYISVESQHPQAQAAQDNEALMARSVRLVRSIAREFDTVGRLSRNRIALLLVDVPPGDLLNDRLSRLVALGLMRDTHAQRDAAIRFRISVGVRKQFAGSFADLDAALQTLAQSEATSAKAIHHLPETVQHRYPR
jgi:two-component system, sensor histidine kinase LadS